MAGNSTDVPLRVYSKGWGVVNLKEITLPRSKDPYKLPEDIFCFINVSGGRTSAFMLRKILDRYEDSLPENCEVVFMNTGKEHPATYEFIREIQERWGVGITWLEYDYVPTNKGTVKEPRHIHRVVSYETSSRHGEPFEKLIDAKKILPNVFQRFCTQELKVVTVQRYAKRDKGIKNYANVLGIRADEGRRVMKGLLTGCALIYPLSMARIRKIQIINFWSKQTFNLEVDSDWSNCDLCFLKGKKILSKLVGQHPEALDWWVAQERKIGPYFFQDFSYKQVQGSSKENTLFDDEKIDCFCGGD